MRSLVKLGFINERPEHNRDARWSETGDRYMIKLFRDYVFHQVRAMLCCTALCCTVLYTTLSQPASRSPMLSLPLPLYSSRTVVELGCDDTSPRLARHCLGIIMRMVAALQVNEAGVPVLDLAHVIECLNKLEV